MAPDEQFNSLFAGMELDFFFSSFLREHEVLLKHLFGFGYIYIYMPVYFARSSSFHRLENTSLDDVLQRNDLLGTSNVQVRLRTYVTGDK